MNDNLHTYIEPELEARITALVLGEASEFEIDELERLIQEKPELAIFRRRIKAMHELLGEAVKPEADENWQLSADRRALLKQTFSRSTTPVKRRSTSAVSLSQKNAAITIAACLVLCVVVFSMMQPMGVTLRRSASESLSYSAASEEYATDEFESRHVGTTLEVESNLSETGDIPVLGGLFRGEKNKDSSIVAKREMRSSVSRKPAAPSSSMAKVIAANTASPTSIPIPEVDVPNPSTDFGNGDDFGDGWGNGDGEGDSFGIVAGSGKFKAEVRTEDLASLQERVVNQKSDLTGAGQRFNTKAQLGSSRSDYEQSNRSLILGNGGFSNVIKGGLKTDLSAYFNYKSDNAISFESRISSRVRGGLYYDDSLNESSSITGYVGASISDVRPDDDLDGLARLEMNWAGSMRSKTPNLTKYNEDAAKYAWVIQDEGRKVEIDLPQDNLQHEFEGFVNYGTPIKGENGDKSSVLETQNKGAELYDVAANDATQESQLKWSSGISMGFDDSLERFPTEGKDSSITAYRGASLVAEKSSSIAQKEVARRGSLVLEADKALIKGREAYAKNDYEEAAKQYKLAQSMLPPGPALADRRHSLNGHLGDASVALAQKYRRVGKLEEARSLLEGTLSKDPTNFAAKKQLEYLDDPIRNNPALTYEHTKNVDAVRKNLYMGEGYYNLGKYDEAEAEMKKVLQKDPYNKAARRWLEKVASTKSDYYRAAYDHTRAELLREVDEVWEATVPPAQQPIASKRPVAKPTPAPRLAMPTSRAVNGKDGKLTALKVELQNKNDRVVELRKRLMDVAGKTGLIYVETEHGGTTIGDVTGLRMVAEKELYDAEGRERQLTFQINKLLSVNDDDLLSVASELPDVGFKEAYKKYENSKSELQTIKASGLAENHPNVVMRKKRVNEMEKSLKIRAVNVRKSLKHSLALTQGQVKNMRDVVNKEQDQGLDTARSMQELNVARKEYELARGIRDGIEAKYDLEKVKLGMPTSERKLKPAKRPAVTIPSPVAPKALPEETTTSAVPFSTFSLNVADVSFKLAKVALLEKGQWPDAAKVRTEEFVNAFDYGDPSPPRGEPVSCAIEQSAHPFLQQRNLLRIGMKTASVGRSTPLRLTVLLDNSGSMEREDRQASVLAAIKVLAAQLGPQDVITLVGFARQPRLLADRLSGDKAGTLVNIVANTPSEGGTNLEEALRLARTLAIRQHTDGAQDRVVLITDGVANLGNTVPEELSKEIETMRQQGIAFDACGVGAEGLNDDILESLTRKGDGRYYFLNRAEDADSGFAKQLAGALSPAAKNVKVQVKFNPKRVSKYRLLGFEKHLLKKEDFRNDKVDAAEMASEEAGNAVYQIQVNPNGEGEVGEVFVRFLDTNTGQMVERSWPLPYEPQARSFDLAEPSMQLAGTAALLGEKLHGTDAGSVRFPMISKTLNQLRGHYAADRKVQDLIRMCEKVR